jgi:hypothetical protein
MKTFTDSRTPNPSLSSPTTASILAVDYVVALPDDTFQALLPDGFKHVVG